MASLPIIGNANSWKIYFWEKPDLKKPYHGAKITSCKQHDCFYWETQKVQTWRRQFVLHSLELYLWQQFPVFLLSLRSSHPFHHLLSLSQYFWLDWSLTFGLDNSKSFIIRLFSHKSRFGSLLIPFHSPILSKQSITKHFIFSLVTLTWDGPNPHSSTAVLNNRSESTDTPGIRHKFKKVLHTDSWMHS